jgi:aldose 1-epimerase
MTHSLASRSFGYLPTGEPVEAWTITGSGGLVAEIITYGGIVTKLLVPGRDGRLDDVVLGFNDLGSYLADRAYFGAVIGRVAGRIPEARFKLDGNTYQLACNDAPNHLHGGIEGFNRKLWVATPILKSMSPPSVRLEYTSPDGEEGYPGSVNVSVTYTVTAENVLLIQSEAASDRTTPLSLTFHSYFNLGGEGTGSIADHELQIHAEEFVPVDESMTLQREFRPVTNSNDFRRLRKLGDAIPHLFQNHGDLYRIRRMAGQNKAPEYLSAARLLHRPSGRVMDVSTTATHLQLYTGASLDGSAKGKLGVLYGPHAGVCLECEGYPNGANDPAMGDILLHPGQRQSSVTGFTFMTLQQ